MTTTIDYHTLQEKADWVRRTTIRLHGLAPETRIASSLSAVELFVTLQYGGIIAFDPANPAWEQRDRLVISKGHGSVSYYPILADLGYFGPEHLETICREGSFLGGIPDTNIPGYETINGSLGYGIGVASGIALGLRAKGVASHVFVVAGDGELYEGSMWEGIMFAAHHRLANLTVIVDNNRFCMLGRCEEIVSMEPLEQRFAAFGWETRRVDGHSIPELHAALAGLKGRAPDGPPAVLIADTVKGKGVPCLESDPLCHIRTLTKEEVAQAIGGDR